MSLTKGIKNAMARGKNRTSCSACGFPLPVYPGRYPSKCPECGAPLEIVRGESESTPDVTG